MVADYYRNSPKEKQTYHPLWKVRELLDELNKQAKDTWVPGKWVVIDAQTLGFQGALGMKLCISYKREGGGFQCDAVCNGRADTPIYLIFVTGRHQMSESSTSILSYHQQLGKSCGLHLGC